MKMRVQQRISIQNIIKKIQGSFFDTNYINQLLI